MIKKICPRCGGYHNVGEQCPKRINYQKKPTAANRFRQTYIWRQKAEDIKKRDNYLCMYCKEHGRYTFKNISVHHITPINADYDRRLDDDNLITLCAECHSKADRGDIEAKELYDIVNNDKENIK